MGCARAWGVVGADVLGGPRRADALKKRCPATIWLVPVFEFRGGRQPARPLAARAFFVLPSSALILAISLSVLAITMSAYASASATNLL